MARKRNSKPKSTANQDRGKFTNNGSRGRLSSKKRDDEGIEEMTKSSNDPAWYASNPALLRDAASYPFSYNTGATEIHNPILWSDASMNGKPADQIPGVCTLRVHPAIGTTHYATDPINVASQSLYSFIRHANSGHANYDAPDLMIYILAMSFIYQFLVWCQRLYGYALTYDQRNRYLPKELVRTNNVDFVDLINNLANFRFWLNTLIAKIVSFAVPGTMSIFSRMSFMYRDYYIEGTSIKEQLYQFAPKGFYQFTLDSEGKGKLTWKAFDFTSLMKVQDIIDYGEDLFNAVWSQEDFGIMSGDILKAYGDNIIKIAPLPEYYNIIPKFDPMVLTQMKNADIIPSSVSDIVQDLTDNVITQGVTVRGFAAGDKYYGDTNALSAANATLINKVLMAVIKDYRILTCDTDAPGPDLVIEATRLKVVYNEAKAWLVAGTEIVEEVVLTVKPNTDILYTGIMAYFHGAATDGTTVVAVTEAKEALQNFHYMPRQWWTAINGTGSATDTVQSFDIDNFTILTFEDVKKLHEAATINMFAVPSIGKVM